MKRLWILILLLLCACASGHYLPKTSAIYEPKPPDYEVKVYFEGEQPELPYKVIGLACAEQPTRGLLSSFQHSAIERLKAEARKHGADAIMDLKVISFRAWGAPWVEAKVIVFLK